MRRITLEQLADILEIMTVNESIDNGFAITHIGHIDGKPTIAISTCRGEGDSFVLQ